MGSRRGRLLLGGLLGCLLLSLSLGLLGLALCLFLGLATGALLGLALCLLGTFGPSLLLLGAEDGVALSDDVADRFGDQRARAHRVVVAGDDVVDAVGVAVGVDQPDDRDTQTLGFAHGDRLDVQVDHEQRVGGALHVLDAAEVGAQLGQIGLGGHALARREQRELTLGLIAFEIVQATDALVDGLEVGQQATEPAVVDVGHVGRLGDLLDRVAGLLLGADEQHGAAAMGDLGCDFLGLLQKHCGLQQVDDVDAVALAMDEAAHLGVPAACLMAEMDSGLQHVRDSNLTHGCSLIFDLA